MFIERFDSTAYDSILKRHVTKIHLLADEDGLPLQFRITAGQAGEYAPAAELLRGQRAEAIIADRGDDADAPIGRALERSS